MPSDLTKLPDQQLLSLLSTGSEEAFRGLYERYWEILFTKAFNFLGSEEGAKDCVQEVFAWLWLHRSEVHIDNVDHYLRQATRFQALKCLREDKAASDFEIRLARVTGDILQSSALEFKELREYLEKLVNALPEDQRLIFRLHREEELTYAQIAQRLGISVKTVEKKMSLSLKFLRLHTESTLGLLLVVYCLS